jgi:hypothetical protein
MCRCYQERGSIGKTRGPLFAFLKNDISVPRGGATHWLFGICALLVSSLVLSLAVPASAELHEGDGYVVTTVDGGWDFSASSFVPSFADADLALHVIRVSAVGGNAPQTYYLVSPGIQFAPVGVDFDSLTVAPDSGYVQTAAGLQYYNYFLQTHEGYFAKVQMLQDDGLQWPFHYVYQDDGSRNLDTSVSVEPTTWGRIKSLYR